jgi:ribosomal protein S18 acetylase RimI-like enzyme
MTSAPPVRVRPARPTDVEALVSFNLELAATTEDIRLDRSRLEAGVRGLLGDPSRGRYLVAEGPAGEVVGCTMLTFEWSDWRNGVFWWIQSVYVQPEARGQGVFRTLFEHIQGQARAQTDPPVAGLRLYVHDDNHHARAVYHRLGLETTAYRVMERDFVLGR